MEIEKMGLSVRAVNVLRREHIETADQLIEAAAHPDKMILWRNLGVKTLQELLAKAEELEREQNGSCKKPKQSAEMVPPVHIVEISFLRAAQGTKIDLSGLSVRAVHALEANQLTDLMQVAGWTAEDYARLPKVGTGTAEELFNKVTAVANSMCIAYAQGSGQRVLTGLYSDSDRQELRGGREEQWLALLETSSAEEWKRLWDQLLPVSQGGETDLCEADILFCTELPAACCEQAGVISEYLKQLGIHVSLGINEMIAARLMAIQGETGREITGERVLDVFFENAIVTAAVDGLLLGKLAMLKRECTAQELLPALPPFALAEGLLERALHRLKACGQLLEEDGGYSLPVQTVEEWAASLTDERVREIIRRNLCGETLEAIGQTYGVTRERVRQIIAKAFGDNIFYEDRYAHAYTAYSVDSEAGVAIFGATAYNYLEARYKRGTAELEQALEDETVKLELRRKIDQVLHRDYLRLGDRWIRKRRNDVMDYVLQTCCWEQTGYDDFRICYEQFCDQHGLVGERFNLDPGTARNRLSLKPDILYAFHERFRYYPIEQYDFGELLDTLNLHRYQDVSYSSLYFFREYPELMRQYDIRDEYELHNLLKKLIGSPNAYDLEFSKMPTLNFGTPRIDEQVLELLIEKAPVTIDELAACYEQRYGVKPAVAMSTYFKGIAEFLEGRTYRIDTPALPADVITEMKKVLTDDFYLLADLTRLYLTTVPGAKKADLSQNALRSFGFVPYNEYAVRDSFRSAAEYFRWILLKEDRFELEQFGEGIMGIQQFWSILAGLRADYEVIEYQPKRFINISRFSPMGIDRESMRQYCRDAFDFQQPARYFSIHSMRAAGFRHPLDDLGFDDWFYSSLLQQDYDHFSVQRMGNVRVICKGRQPFSRTDVLRDIVERYGKIDMDDLIDLLANDLGIDMDAGKLSMLIDQSEMHYDRIMHTVYVDYDAYFDDI